MVQVLKWLSRNKIRALILILLFLLSCFFYYGLGDKILGMSMMGCLGFLLIMMDNEKKSSK